MSESRPVLFERRDGVGIATISRPEVRNAIDQAVVDSLHAICADIERAPDDLRVLVITGAGEKAFAAGADIRQLLARTSKDALRAINSAIFERIERLPIPTIAAIRGYALGGGCELALACDLRIAGRSAKLGQPEVALGIIPAAGATYRLPRLVGLGKARELIFTGRLVTAEEALAIGLVNKVVDDAALNDEALAMARDIAKNAGSAVRLAKVMLNAAARGAHFGEVESLAQALLFDGEEKKTRMTAFLERK